MRTRARWTRRARLLWLFAAIIAGLLAWWDWQESLGRRSAGASADTGSAAGSHAADDDLVEVEIVPE